MPFEPEKITIAHVEQAVRRIRQENLPLKLPTGYDVIIDGKPYPPKEIMRYAHEEMNGERIWNKSGGEPTNKYLQAMGYDIQTKDQKEKIEQLIETYTAMVKSDRNEGEVYKWKLLQQFQGRPDVESPAFAHDFLSIDYKNLLYHRQRRTTIDLATKSPDEFRLALKALFDDDIGLSTRIQEFVNVLDRPYSVISSGLKHWIDERTISTFLTFHDPSKYTFFKDKFYQGYCKLLGITPKSKFEKYEHYLSLIDDLVNNYIAIHPELLKLKSLFLDETCYPDANNLIFAQDILYRTLQQGPEEAKEQAAEESEGENEEDTDDLEVGEGIQYWVISPGKQAREWDEFYKDGIIGIGWDRMGDLRKYPDKEAIKRRVLQLDPNGSKTPNNNVLALWEFCHDINIGDVLIAKVGNSEYLGYGIVTSDYIYDTTREEYKHIRKVDWKQRGNWKAGDSRAANKSLTNITRWGGIVEHIKSIIGLKLEGEGTESARPSAETSLAVKLGTFPLNQIFYGPPGTGKTYNSVRHAVDIIQGGFDNEKLQTEDENRKYQAAFQSLRKAGQIEFITFHQNYSYEDFLIGIKPDVDYEELRFESREGVFYKIVKRATENYLASLERRNHMRSFEDVLDEILLPLDKGNEIAVKMSSGISFWITDRGEHGLPFRKASGGTGHTLSLRTLKQVFEGRSFDSGLGVYYHPFANLIREKQTLPGVAERTVQKRFVLIIDEINRANISRVFGELITLLEEDKRIGAPHELTVTLPNGDEFSIPPNLYIVGTMNTADRSIALVDIALRRRFTFKSFIPKYDIGTLNDRAKTLLKKINENIYAKKGSTDYLIGHAFFMQKGLEIEIVLRDKIIPLLMEYFGGKSKIVEELFQGTDYKVTFNTVTYEWDISPKSSE
jgi:hypothetical protein